MKALVFKGSFDEPIKLIGDIFTLHFVPNYNIAFSLPLGGPWLIGGIIIILLLLMYYLVYSIKNKQNLEASLLFLVMIGAILNLIDRIKYGYVVDYFDLKWFTVFNLADSLICCAVFGLIVLNLKTTKSK